jgi:hypothetical protein
MEPYRDSRHAAPKTPAIPFLDCGSDVEGSCFCLRAGSEGDNHCIGEMLDYLRWHWVPWRGFALQVGYVTRSQAAYVDRCRARWRSLSPFARMGVGVFVVGLMRKIEAVVKSFE